MQTLQEGKAAIEPNAKGNENQDRVLRQQLDWLADVLASGDPRREVALRQLKAAPAVGRELAGRLVARLLGGDEETALLAGEALVACGWGAVPALHEALLKARRPAGQLRLVGALAMVAVVLDFRGRGAVAAILGGLLAEGLDVGVRMAALAALSSLRRDGQVA